MRFRFIAEGGTALLAVVGPECLPGEYTGQIVRIGDEAGRGPLEIGVGSFAFEPSARRDLHLRRAGACRVTRARGS